MSWIKGTGKPINY